MESSSKSQTIACDIVLLPSKDQAELAAQASQKLTSQGSLFTLDNQNRYAHASLYMFQMNLENQAACIAALQQLAEQTNVQQLMQDDYLYQDSGFGQGYFDIAFARDTAVDALQMQAVDIFNGLRASMRESDKQKLADATGTMRENLEKYGYPSIGKLFRPHITLTKFLAEITPDLTILPPPTVFSGEFDRLGLFEMGPNGTCIREIASFPLAG